MDLVDGVSDMSDENWRRDIIAVKFDDIEMNACKSGDVAAVCDGFIEFH